MGFLRDITDTIIEVKNVFGKVNANTTRKYSSISTRSMEGTLQFPVIVSKSMDIDTLQIISKALERQYASFIQTVISMNPDLNISKDGDAAGYLRKFHQNTGIKQSLDDVGNIALDYKLNTKNTKTLASSARSLFEASQVVSEMDEDLLFFSGVYEGSTGRVVAENKKQLVDLFEHVRTDILNNKFTPQTPSFRFTNENYTNYHNRILREAKGDNVNGNAGEQKQLPAGAAAENRGGSRSNDFSGKMVPDRMLRDNDVRKSNELVPTTMHVRVQRINDNQEAQGYLDFIIGIKTTLHPVSSDEMTTNLLNAIRQKGKFFNFIRWTSGEISFFKDFMFNIGEIKNDVANRSNGSSPWWISLKRRRSLSKIKSNLQGRNQILPNATIVVSMDEVDAIRSEYGFDLMKPDTVDKIMGIYFLLGFVVVDNSAQIAHFLFDGQTNYQSVSFGGLERENSSKTDLRDVMKVIDRSKMI